jgi:hypothetical protein
VVLGLVGLGLAAPVGRVELTGLADLADRADLVPEGQVAQVVLVLAGRAGLDPEVLGLAAPVGRVELTDRVDLADRVGRVVLGLVNPAGRVELTDRVDLADRVGRVVLGLVVQVGLVNPAGLGPVVRVAPGLTDRADRAAPVGPVVLAPVARVVPGLMGPVVPVVPVDPAGRVDRLRRHTYNVVFTTGVARSGVAPGMHRTASARRIMAHRLRRRNTDSAGTVDLLPERRRQTGTARRLLVAGTGRRLLVAGTRNGTGRHAT